MSCITIYSPVLSATQEGYNELRVTTGYKPLWGKQPDHQHVSDFPRVADALGLDAFDHFSTIAVTTSAARV